MARLISTTVRLAEQDVRALKRARAAGHSASDLVRKGLRVVASREALRAKEVIDLYEHQARNVTSAGLVDGTSKEPVVLRALDEVSSSAPVSQISAAVLPADTEQLALVAALGQRADYSRASRLGMPSGLLQHQRKVLPDELRTRDAALTRCTREQPIVLWTSPKTKL